jgi:DNA-binding NarL/FixJ family response regulator
MGPDNGFEAIPNPDSPNPDSPDPDGEIAVLIVEDHAMVAEGLSAALSEEKDVRVVGVVGTLAAAYDAVERAHPDVVLLDFGLPDGDGATGTEEILRRRPGTRVVMFTGSGSHEVLVRAIEAGCAGFLHKSKSIDEVVLAVRAAYAGEALFSPAVLSDVVSRLRKPEVPYREPLSPREREVLTMLAEGMATQDIATTLFLSLHTVRNHVRNILTKLGAHSKLEAVAIAAREGLVDLTPTR